MSGLINEDNNNNNDRQPPCQEIKHDIDVKIKKSLKKDVKLKQDDKIEKTELDDLEFKSESK